MEVTLRFSLILATYGRYKEVETLLQSLLLQSFHDYELIIVDQNPKGFLQNIIDKYSNEIKIVYIHESSKGLSSARNTGLKRASGEIIGFPDDDCVYEQDTLEQVNKLFINDVAAITGEYVYMGMTQEHNIDKKCIKLNKYNVWKHGISFTIFIRSNVCREIGCFNEELGVGSGTQYGSGEETDYLLRIIEQNLYIINSKKPRIYHPAPIYDDFRKAYRYSLGRMYVIDKHNYNILFVFVNILYPLVKMIIYFYSFKKLRYCWYQFLGRIRYYM